MIYPYQQGVTMKKINTLFTNASLSTLSSFADESMNSKSEISRAAMSIGLGMISAARISMTDREFYAYINESQDIDESITPKPMEK